MAKSRTSAVPSSNGAAAHLPSAPIFGADPILANKLALAVNGFVDRWSRLLDRFADPRKDIESECGWPAPQNLPRELYQGLYDRLGVAERVVNFMPSECIKEVPTVYESKGGSVTEFERAWDSIGEQLDEERSAWAGAGGNDGFEPLWEDEEETSAIWEYVYRLDEQSGIGHYGVLYVGIDDGKDPSEPAELKPGGKARHRLTQLLVFPESQALVTRVETDRNSPRFGMPTEYQLQIENLDEDHGGGARIADTVNVHWSRVLHAAEQRRTNNIYAVPRMRPHLNDLLDLRKITGAASEGYWRAAFAALALSTHPQLGGDVQVDPGELRRQMENLWHSLDRGLLLTGMSASTLAPQLIDPTPYVNGKIELICITGGWPVRIFKGSERGELASSQDEIAHKGRVKRRRIQYLTPRIIKRLIKRLVLLGVLPQPKSLFVEWPDELDLAAAEKKAAILNLRTQAYAAYAAGVATMIPEMDYMTKFDDMTEEDAVAILEAAEAKAIEDEAEAAAKAEEMGFEEAPPEGFEKPELEEPPQPVKIKPGEKLVVPPKGGNQ